MTLQVKGQTTLKEKNLYLVTTEEYSNKSTLEIAEEATRAGIDILQMREKQKSYDELVLLGKKLSKLCKERGVLFIINDNPVLAKEVDADGVHLGQEDIKEMQIEKVRGILKDRIIGLSTHSLEQVRKANLMDIDYIAFGPVFKTQTKDYFLGTKDIKEVIQISNKPVVFIGGIKMDNIDVLIKLGAKNIAVITEITKADDIHSKVKQLKDKLGV